MVAPCGTLPTAWKRFSSVPGNHAHAQQAGLWTCAKRFVGAVAGRGSGKTDIAKRKLAFSLGVRKPWSDPRYFYAAPTYAQAKRIAWSHLCQLVPPAWIAPNGISASDLRIRTVFGSEVWVVGLDKPQRIEGVQWDGGVVDESSDVRAGTFDLAILPALSWRNGWCWRIGVPKRYGVGAQEFQRFYTAAASGELADAAAFTWSSEDVLPQEALESARRNMDPRDYREQFLASWEDASGAIFHAFSDDYNVRPCSHRPDMPILVGSDFNVDPMAWVLCHKHENRLEAFDEIWIRNINTQGTLDVLFERYKHHTGGFQFYGDASGKGRRTSAAFTDIAIIANDPRFKRLGRTIHYLNSNPPIADRFAATNSLICNAAGERRFFVDPRAKHLIEDLRGRQYAPGTRELPAKEGDLGHATDAMGYIVFRLYPIRIEVSSAPEIIVSGGQYAKMA